MTTYLYNWTNLTGNQTTDLLGVTQFVNNVLLDGWFGNIVLISIFIIWFWSYAQSPYNTIRQSFGSAMLITASIGLLFKLLNLITDKIFYSLLILAALGAIGIYFENKSQES